MKILLAAFLLAVMPAAAQMATWPSGRSSTPRTVTATIAAGGSLSPGVDLAGCTVARIELPAITSAVLTFQASEDGATYRELEDWYAPVQLRATTGNKVFWVETYWYGVRWIKVRSGTASSAVTQTNAVNVNFVCKD